MKLPDMLYGNSYSTQTQEEFRGLNSNKGAQDGEFLHMTNMTGQYYPVMSPRARRGLMQTLDTPNAIYADDSVVLVDGTKLYIDGVEKGTVIDGPKQIVRMLSKIVMFPDKLIYDLNAGTLKSMGSEVSFTGLSFQNGTIFGEAAEANTIYKSGADWGTHFSVGDAVSISGASIHPENNLTPVIREIDGDYLRFYENTFVLDPSWSYTPGTNGIPAGTYHFTAGDSTRQFTLAAVMAYGEVLTWGGTTLTLRASGTTTTIATTAGSGGTELEFQETATKPYIEPGTISFSKNIPDLDFICVNENRLWGCKGDSIYASKLGDPTNFYVFDGLSTDSWQSDVGDKGDFTACISYLGYPVFFKEESVFKVYGDRPANFQWTPSARFGVAAGSDRSLAVANETLYYLSATGVVAYNGGIPSIISEPLGVDKRWHDAVAGSDGLRYYVSMTDEAGETSLYVYDTQRGMWHREDDLDAVGFAYYGHSLRALDADGRLLSLDGIEGDLENAVPWEAEFADYTNNLPVKKGVLRILLRCELDEGSSLSVGIQYDAQTRFETIRTVTAQAKQSYVLPLIVRRCDHWRLKLSGIGGCKVYSLALVRYSGSEKQGAAFN